MTEIDTSKMDAAQIVPEACTRRVSVHLLITRVHIMY